MIGNEQFNESGVLKYNPNRHELVITGERRPTISIATQALPYELDMPIPQMVAHCLTALSSPNIGQLQVSTTRISPIGNGREIQGEASFVMSPENVDIILEQLVFSDVWRMLSGSADESIFHGLSDYIARGVGGFWGSGQLKSKIRNHLRQGNESEIEKIRAKIRKNIETRADVSNIIGLQQFAAECFWATQGKQYYDAYSYAFNTMVHNARVGGGKMKNRIDFGLNISGRILNISHYLDSRELPIEVPIFYGEYNRINELRIETDGAVGVRGGAYGKNTLNTVEVTQGFTPSEIAENTGVLVIGLPQFEARESNQKWDPIDTYGYDTWKPNGTSKLLTIVGTGNGHTIVRVVINDSEYKAGTKNSASSDGARVVAQYSDTRRPTLTVRPNQKSGYREGLLQIAGFNGSSNIGHNRGDVVLIDSGVVVAGEIDGNLKIHNTSGQATKVHGSYSSSGNGYFNKEYKGK